MPRSNEEARTTFATLVDEIQSLLDDIREAADSHFDTEPDEVTWSHVGDVTRTRNQLAEIRAHIRGETP